jgi:hypothetical protein
VTVVLLSLNRSYQFGDGDGSRVGGALLDFGILNMESFIVHTS